MTEENQQFSEEAIRRFLLGKLSQPELAAFEQSLVTNDELSERVRLAELELSDDYVANRLSESERQGFAAGFLLTADRQWQLNVSRALQQKLSAPTRVRMHKSILARFVSLFDVRAHAWKYAFAALILMLLLGTALLLKREQLRIAGGPPSSRSPAPKLTGTPTTQPMHHVPNSAPPTHAEQSPALPLHEGLTPSVVLNANTPLEAAPVIRTSGDVLTLELRLDQPLAGCYDVHVMTTSGESVFIENAIKRTEADTLGFDVPASAIESGDFQIVLMRADSEPKQRAGTYYLRVR